MVDYDLIIRGGTLVDGSGADARRGDVAVKDGQIAAVGDVDGDATEVIDATDEIVAPGFIDAHTHYDAQVLWDPMLTVSPWHGVTTAVMGNCGYGFAPTRAEHRDVIIGTLERVEGMNADALRAGLGADWGFESFPSYLDTIERRGVAINVGVLFGHTPLRLFVMGEEAFERVATDAEVDEMRRLLAEGLEVGAAGFATSRSATGTGDRGRPLPTRQASDEEIFALCDKVARAGHGIIQVNPGPSFFIDHMTKVAKQTGRPVTWTSLTAGHSMGGRTTAEDLAQSEAVAGEGVKLVPQVSPRQMSLEMTFERPYIFESLPLFAPAAKADSEEKLKVYADEEFRRAVRDGVDQGVGFLAGFSTMVVTNSPAHPELTEVPLSELAAKRGVHLVDAAFDLALENLFETRFRLATANHDEEVVERLLLSDATMLGSSDAGAHASMLCDACLPTYLLGHWVREKQAVPLEYAVWMLTGQAADVFAVPHRGRLQVGMAGDIVVFDPETVGAGPLYRTFDLPQGADRLKSDAFGISHVIVNGRSIRRHGADTVSPEDAELPGTVLRFGKAGAV